MYNRLWGILIVSITLTVTVVVSYSILALHVEGKYSREKWPE